jgi:hypothetical protein
MQEMVIPIAFEWRKFELAVDCRNSGEAGRRNPIEFEGAGPDRASASLRRAGEGLASLLDGRGVNRGRRVRGQFGLGAESVVARNPPIVHRELSLRGLFRRRVTRAKVIRAVATVLCDPDVQ